MDAILIFESWVGLRSNVEDVDTPSIEENDNLLKLATVTQSSHLNLSYTMFL
jgi:hypothetical protein